MLNCSDSDYFRIKSAFPVDFLQDSTLSTKELSKELWSGLKGKIDGVKYRKILQENLLSCVRKLKLGWKFTFQHDDDPKHTDKLHWSD